MTAEEVTVDYILAKGLRRVYDLTAVYQIREGLGILAEEILRYENATKVRVSTEKGPSAQRIIIAWDGMTLPDDLVARLNDSYAEGAGSVNLGGRHGSKMAAYWFSFADGKVKIENHEDGVYKVRNVVDFPLI